MRSAVATALLGAAVNAAGYIYNTNGADWGSVNALCDSGTEQSPVDLNNSATLNDNLAVSISGY